MKVVMMVDDDPRLIRLMKSQLERELNCRVYGVADARHAVNMALLLNPDVIVLDVAMPDHDGGEVASQLRACQQLSRVPIIFYSGLLTGPEAAQLKQQGCRQTYVSKLETLWGLTSVIRREFNWCSADATVSSVLLQPT